MLSIAQKVIIMVIIMNKIKLSGNQLKILALVTMTIDHLGLMLLHDYVPFRIIGRLSFPIFAFMIAEGCRYTRYRLRYFLQIFFLAVLCQTVLFITERSLYQGIFTTFSLSILMIYSVQWAKQKESSIAWFLPLITIGLFFLLYRWMLTILHETDFSIDYGFTGALLPLLVSLSAKRKRQLLSAAVGIISICLSIGDIQWYSLLALIPLKFYNGRKGTWNLKYLFYFYYPLHLICIYAIASFV